MTPSPSISTETWETMFALGGEMGALMRSVDWAATPIGPIQAWPQSLRTAVSICLTSRFPMIVWWGPELTLFYNDGYRPMLGAKHPRSMGQPGLECWAEIRDIIGPMLHKVLSTGEATWSEDQLLPLERNGFVEECYFTFSYSPIFDESGGVGGVFTAVTETTSRVLSERRMRLLRELAATAARTRTVEDTCASAMDTLAEAIADLPFALLYLLESNGTRARLCGASGLTLDPQRMPASADVVELDPATGARDWPLQQVISSGQPVYLTNAGERLRAFGAVCPAEPDAALILPVTQPGQEQPYGVLVAGVSPRLALDDTYRGFFELVAGHLATAITNAHAYEEERRRAEALAELDRAKTVFFSNVSHEFRTPLTLLLGPLEDLRADPSALTPHQRDQLDLIHRNGLRLLKLVNTLLDFSRIEAGRVEALYAPVDLAALTAELASTFRSLVEQAGLTLRVECPPLPRQFYVDTDMWEKIVLNLLSNAFKFTFAGEIAVSLRAEGERAVLRVRDTGVGVAPEDLPHLFERFHRVHGARSRTYEGSGIGLALVQELVKLHGGDIAVTSEPGVGTTFTVSLPAGASHLPADRIGSERAAASASLGAAPYVEEASRWLSSSDATPAAASLIPAPHLASPAYATDLAVPPALADAGRVGQAEILVADDNADMRDYLSHLLSGSWRVRVVTNGAEALAAARERLPNLILSDVMMPGMDGLQLVRELRADARTRAIPVLLLSARAGQEAAIEGLESGADDYLVKPFSARELVARVASHLELARLRRMAVEQAAQLGVIFQAMTDAIFVFDARGALIQSNAAGSRLLEISSFPPFINQAPSSVPDAAPAMRDEHGRPLAGDEWPRARILRGEGLTGPAALDVLVRLEDGGDMQINLTGAPVRDASGAIVGGIMVCRDVTERRRLERRTHEVLRALLDMAATIAGSQASADDGAEAASALQTAVEPVPSPSAVPLDSTQRDVREVLAVAQQALAGRYTGCVLVDTATGDLRPLAVEGLTPRIERRWWRDLSNKKLSAYFTPDSIERLYAEEVLAFDFAGRPPVAGQNYFDLTTVLVVPVRLDAQRLLLLAVEARDHATFTIQERELAHAAARLASLVVERERLLGERASAEASVLALRESNRRMDEFLGIASHELRTPLTSITASVQFSRKQLHRLQGDQDAALPSSVADRLSRLASMMDRADRQVARLDRLVGDLLDVSRIQSGKLTLEPEPTDLGDIVRESVDAQRAFSLDRSITLSLPRHQRIPVLADADRIGQVVTNYLTNAIRYSPPGTPIAVHVRAHGQRARVEVHDQGVGIPKEQQARIWNRFHRVPGIEQQSVSGLGLGLYICASIIERHGGQVGVESVPGKGSNFWFTLPLSEPVSSAAS